MATRRGEVLELAVLGVLHDSPLHGYELRKRLGAVLGPLHQISYGSLYPRLKDLENRGLLTATETDGGPRARARIVYQLTPEGKERLQTLLDDSGPDAWDDQVFGVRYAFFGRTRAEVRLRVLEGRRSRLEEQVATLRASLSRTRDRLDTYTTELQQHGLESAQREVRWLDELIASERSRPASSAAMNSPASTTSQDS